MIKKRMAAAFLLALSFASGQTAKDLDIWSGSYAVYPQEGAPAQDTLLIAPAKDLKPDEVAARFEADLARWSIRFKKDSNADSALIRRFLSNSDEDEYREFGWSEQHKNGTMNCADAGHFFICQTKPQSTVTLKDEKPFYTKSGIFGVWLHYGLVALEKIK